jgi:hypothetical protein
MKRRTAAIAVTGVVLVSMAAVGVVILMADTRYHFERPISDGISKFMLILQEISDCNLTIMFSDDPALLYSMDIEYYNPVPIWSADPLYRLTVGPKAAGVTIWATRSMKSLNITLGPTAYSVHMVMCDNCNSSIIYDGIVAQNQTLYYCASGMLRLTVTEEVGFNVGGAIRCSECILDISVPDGFSGGVYFDTPDLNIVERTGWQYEAISSSESVFGYGTYEEFYDHVNRQRNHVNIEFSVECDILSLKLRS